MYPYDNPQVAALAQRYNPQYAPIQRQGQPTTSGQIQPAGLQPQPGAGGGMMLRPQVAALANRYNPQFTPQMQGGNPNAPGMGTQLQNLGNSVAQFQLAQQNPQNNYAQTYAAIMNNPNMTDQQRQAAMQLQQQAQYNPTWAANPQYWPSSGVTPNGVNQLNALTGGAYSGGNPQPQPAMQQPMMAPPAYTSQPYANAQPANMPQIPMNGYAGAANMGQPYGGGINGLARYYTR